MLLALVSVGLGFALNFQFLTHCRYSEMIMMNDVKSIVAGYHRTPSLAGALTAYWPSGVVFGAQARTASHGKYPIAIEHKPWIQEDIYCFRPVSGLQYWVETWIGLNHGFLWNAWIFGLGLFALSSWLCGLIVYRFTQSDLLALMGVVMACGVRFYNACQPDYWLAWYPMHQDLLMAVFLLGAVLTFDTWLGSGRRGTLALTWALFILGCLTKEHAFAFPFMAVSLALTRPAARGPRRAPALVQGALFTGFVGLLVVIRKLMYVVPRDPHFRAAVIFHKPGMFMYSSLAIDLITRTLLPPLLAVVLVGFAIAVWKLRPRAVFAIPALLAGLCAASLIATGSVAIGLWEVIDTPVTLNKIVTDSALVSTILLAVVCWRRHAVAASWLLLFWSYLPVISFIGWHYAFPGGLFRAIYWPVMLQAALALCLAWDIRAAEIPWLNRANAAPAPPEDGPVPEPLPSGG